MTVDQIYNTLQPLSKRSFSLAPESIHKGTRKEAREEVERHSKIIEVTEDFIVKINYSLFYQNKDATKYINLLESSLTPGLVNDEPQFYDGSKQAFVFGLSFENEYRQLYEQNCKYLDKIKYQLSYLKSYQKRRK